MLRRGSRGDLVRQLQEDLNRIKSASDPLLGTDGIFGARTESRLRSFQERYALQVDGIAGPKTLSKLDAVARQAPKSSAPSAAPKAAAAPRALSPSEMSPEEVHEFIRQYSDDYERLRRGLGSKLDTFATWAGFIIDAQGFLEAVGFLDKAFKTSTASTASAGVSFFGVFVMTYTFLREWEHALRSGELVYGYRAAAYAATAWAFERPMLNGSRTIRQRAVDMRGEERGQKLDEAWKESTDRVRLHLQTKHFDGTSPQLVKRTIQALYGNQPGPYCRDLLREFDSRISPQHIAVWRDNHHIVYPN